MVIDIGGGTSETAVISLGGIVALEAVRVGSFDIDAAIQALRAPRARHRDRRAHRGRGQGRDRFGATPTDDENQAEVRGRDLMSGLPKTVVPHPGRDPAGDRRRHQQHHCIGGPLPRRRRRPSSAQDFLVRGMYLVGGGGLLLGLAQRIERDAGRR